MGGMLLFQMSNRALHELFICLGTLLYGVSIVLAREAMGLGVGPYTFNALQHIVGTLMLLIVRKQLKKMTGNENTACTTAPSQLMIKLQQLFPFVHKIDNFELYVLSIACAVPTFFASTFNQLGLVSVSAGKSAFITSLYVVITPILQYLFLGSKAELTTSSWVSAAVSLLGSYLLAGCFTGEVSLGEWSTLLGAFLFAVEINAMDHSVDRVNCIDLTCLQMCVSMSLCIVTALVNEPESVAGLIAIVTGGGANAAGMGVRGWALVITGGLIEAVAFQLHMVGQVHTTGSRAALLMGLESVVTVVVAFLVLDEVLSPLELLGCAMILASTLVVSSSAEVAAASEGSGEDVCSGACVDVLQIPVVPASKPTSSTHIANQIRRFKHERLDFLSKDRVAYLDAAEEAHRKDILLREVLAVAAVAGGKPKPSAAALLSAAAEQQWRLVDFVALLAAKFSFAQTMVLATAPVPGGNSPGGTPSCSPRGRVRAYSQQYSEPGARGKDMPSAELKTE
jgi:drug/metabolite transporter (DMT)-like permease